MQVRQWGCAGSQGQYAGRGGGYRVVMAVCSGEAVGTGSPGQ